MSVPHKRAEGGSGEERGKGAAAFCGQNRWGRGALLGRKVRGEIELEEVERKTAKKMLL